MSIIIILVASRRMHQLRGSRHLPLRGPPLVSLTRALFARRREERRGREREREEDSIGQLAHIARCTGCGILSLVLHSSPSRSLNSTFNNRDARSLLPSFQLSIHTEIIAQLPLAHLSFLLFYFIRVEAPPLPSKINCRLLLFFLSLSLAKRRYRSRGRSIFVTIRYRYAGNSFVDARVAINGGGEADASSIRSTRVAEVDWLGGVDWRKGGTVEGSTRR